MRKSLFALILFLSAVASAHAQESAELEQAIRQLNSAKQALLRAEKIAKTTPHQRLYFHYPQAHQDIDLVVQGIRHYINSERLQPRDPRQLKTLSGEYDKLRAVK